MSLLPTLRRTRLPRRPSAALLATVAALLAGEWLLWTTVERVTNGTGEFPVWLPQFGSIGQTVVAYATVFDVLTFVVLPVVLVWIGYALGRRSAPIEA